MLQRGAHRLVAWQPLQLLLVFVVVGELARSWNTAERRECIDYYQFWVVGDALRSDEARDIYSDAERERLGLLYHERSFANLASGRRPGLRARAADYRPVLETYSTPWFYALFGISGTGRYRHDQAWFQRVSTASCLVGLIALFALLGFTASDGLIGVAVLLKTFAPFNEDEGVGNVGRLQFGLLVAMAWLLVRTRWRSSCLLAGLVLGLTIAFKPNIATIGIVLAVGWVLTRQWRKLTHVVAGSLVGASAAVAVSSAYFGSISCWTSWTRQLAALLAPGAWGEPNYSLPRLMREQVGFDHPLLLRIALPALVVALLFVGRKRILAARAAGDEASATMVAHWDVLLIGLGVTLPLLTAELAWFHYFVSTPLLALYILRPRSVTFSPRSDRWRQMLALVALVAISLEIPRTIFSVPVTDVIVIVASGAVLLFAAACWTIVAESQTPATA